MEFSGTSYRMKAAAHLLVFFDWKMNRELSQAAWARGYGVFFATVRRYSTSIVDTLSGGSDNCNVEPFTGSVETSTGATLVPACTCACAEVAVI